MTERIRIALQKKGRLQQSCEQIFKNCGLSYNVGERQLYYSISEMPIDLLFVRDDDIPSLVSQGTCDFGIVGLNTFEEEKYENKDNFNASIFAHLGISKCRLSVAIPEAMNFGSLSDLNGLTIATTYPNIVKNFLKQNNIKASTVLMNGSVEISPSLKLADIIADIVSSGATLKQNNLKEIITILESEAVLINNNNINGEKRDIANRLMVRMNSAISVTSKKYVVLNAPKDKVDEIVKILPGSESPSMLPLANKDMISIHAICTETMFWDVMEKLKRLGASSIAVLPIEKMLD